MSNFETAKLVRSVISDRDLIPVLSHFHMYNGRLQGTNGKLTLDAPWPEYGKDESLNIPAEPFVAAFETMNNPDIALRDEFLYVTEKKMKVKIPLSPDPYPVCPKPTEWDPMDDTLLAASRKIRPFISEDASRPWACGVKYIGGHLYATNNIVIVRTPWTIGSFSDVEEFDFPGFGVEQLIKCNLSITGLHVRDAAIGIEMSDVWMESVRYTDPWREVMPMFDKWDYENMPALGDDVRAGVEKLIPFCPDKRHPVIVFEGDKISTLEGNMSASIEIPCGKAALHATPLLEILKVASHMKFDEYPGPIPWKGEGIQGIVAPVRV